MQKFLFSSSSFLFFLLLFIHIYLPNYGNHQCFVFIVVIAKTPGKVVCFLKGCVCVCGGGGGVREREHAFADKQTKAYSDIKHRTRNSLFAKRKEPEFQSLLWYC